MMHRYARGFVIGCAGLLFAFCGSDSASDDEPLPEDELAASMLLTISDFPTGWSETPEGDDDDDSAFEACPNYEMQVGRARTGDFGRGGPSELSHSIGVFESEAAAVEAQDEARQLFQERLVGLLGQGLAARDPAVGGELAVTPVELREGAVAERTRHS